MNCKPIDILCRVKTILIVPFIDAILKLNFVCDFTFKRFIVLSCKSPLKYCANSDYQLQINMCAGMKNKLLYSFEKVHVFVLSLFGQKR